MSRSTHDLRGSRFLLFSLGVGIEFNAAPATERVDALSRGIAWPDSDPATTKLLRYGCPVRESNGARCFVQTITNAIRRT